MILVLFRHGLAEDEVLFAECEANDELRPLVKKGVKRTLKMAKSFAKYMSDVDEIVSSPLTRAAQTTEVLERLWSPAVSSLDHRLKPDAGHEETWQLLLEKKALKKLICVGHEPHLTMFASWLISRTSQAAQLSLKKSGMIILRVNSFESANATLLALIAPKKEY